MQNFTIELFSSVPAVLRYRKVIGIGTADNYQLYIGNKRNLPVLISDDFMLIGDGAPTVTLEPGQEYFDTASKTQYIGTAEGNYMIPAAPVDDRCYTRGVLSQIGTAAPVYNVIESNRLTLTFSRQSAGKYTAAIYCDGVVLTDQQYPSTRGHFFLSFTPAPGLAVTWFRNQLSLNGMIPLIFIWVNGETPVVEIETSKYYTDYTNAELKGEIGLFDDLLSDGDLLRLTHFELIFKP
jgi:hypothetical protein